MLSPCQSHQVKQRELTANTGGESNGRTADCQKTMSLVSPGTGISGRSDLPKLLIRLLQMGVGNKLNRFHQKSRNYYFSLNNHINVHR